LHRNLYVLLLTVTDTASNEIRHPIKTIDSKMAHNHFSILILLIIMMMALIGNSNQERYDDMIRVLPDGILTPQLYNHMEKEIDALQYARRMGMSKGTMSEKELLRLGTLILRKNQAFIRMRKLQDKLNDDDDNYWRVEDRQEDERKLKAMVHIAMRGGDPLSVEPGRF